jgi:hypothetical protein
VSETGTAVPRSKTLRGQGSLRFYRRPTFASLVPACHFDLHEAIMAQPGADKKPTVVFLA